MTREVSVSSLFASRLADSENPEDEIIEVVYPEEITSLLEDIHDNYPGFERIDSLAIDSSDIDNEGNGSIGVGYDVVYFDFDSGDIDTDKRSMNIGVEYDQRETITLTGEEDG